MCSVIKSPSAEFDTDMLKVIVLHSVCMVVGYCTLQLDIAYCNLLCCYCCTRDFTTFRFVLADQTAFMFMFRMLCVNCAMFSRSRIKRSRL